MFKVNEVLSKIDVGRLKLFLCFHGFPDFKPRISECSTTADVLMLIQEQCSLIDITLLDETIKHLEISEARPIIDAYRESNEAFIKDLPLRLSLEEHFFPHPALECEKAVFIVNKNVKDYILEDARRFLDAAFKELGKKVRVVVIKEENSYTIICSFPLTLSESLISTALKNLKALKEKGIIKLTIGYCTVYDCKEVSNSFLYCHIVSYNFYSGYVLYRRRRSKGFFRYTP